MKSSAPLVVIKAKIHPKLNEYFYFIWPTPLKVTKTIKIGWLYLAHLDLVYQGNFIKTLVPLLHTHTRRNIKFQVIPTTENVEVNSNTVSQQVFTLQDPSEEANFLQNFYTTTFSNESEVNTGYLTRYIFVPSHQLSDCTKNISNPYWISRSCFIIIYISIKY